MAHRIEYQRLQRVPQQKYLLNLFNLAFSKHLALDREIIFNEYVCQVCISLSNLYNKTLNKI